MKRASYEIGEREGIKKGIKEGIEQGIEQGIEKERTKTLEIAKNLYREGKAKENIIKWFNLTDEESQLIF